MCPPPSQPQALKCDRCGAYLEMPADPSIHTIACRYCNYQQLLPDIAQRRAAVQSAQLMKQGMQLATRAADTSRRMGAIAGLIAVALPLLIIGGVFTALYQQGLFGNVLSASWNGQGPLVCGANQHMQVSNVTANQPGSQVVIASGNCHLSLTNVNITANTPILAYGNAQVTVVGGSLVSTAGTSIVARDNAAVIVSGASVVGSISRANNATIAGIPGAM